jgi:hypothetical protein
MLIVTMIVGSSMMAAVPTASAEDSVAYEITSQDIGEVNLEYYDQSERKALQHVQLPWRMNVTVANPYSNDAEVRADWRPTARPSRWVTVRIIHRAKVLCENTLDVGNSACYGSTSFRN